MCKLIRSVSVGFCCDSSVCTVPACALYRIKFNLFVCSPYGEYELDLDVESFDDEDTTRWTRIAYELENGADEVHYFIHLCFPFGILVVIEILVMGDQC